MIQDLGMVQDSSGGRQELRGNIQHRIFASYLRLALYFFTFLPLPSPFPLPFIFAFGAAVPRALAIAAWWDSAHACRAKDKFKGSPRPPFLPSSRCRPAEILQLRTGRLWEDGEGAPTFGPYSWPPLSPRSVREGKTNHQDMEGPGRT